MVGRRSWLLVLVLVLVGALLRLPLLASRPFWFDELGQLSVSEVPTIGALIQRTEENERAPPGYALLLHGVVGVGGDSEWVARLPSFVAGVASIVMAFLAGKRWSSARAGLIFAALVAVSPPFVFFAREARPYSLGAFAVFWLLAAAPRAGADTRSTLFFALAVVACAVMQWLSGLVAAVVIAVSAFVPSARNGGRSSRNALLVGSALGVLVLLLEVPILVAELHVRGVGGGFLEGSFYEPRDVMGFARHKVPELLHWLVVGRPGLLTVVIDLWRLPLDDLPAILVAVAAALALPRRVACVALVPLAIVFVAAGIHLHPFGGIRHCLPLAPGIFLLIACGLDELGRHSRAISGLVAAALVACSAHGIHDVRDWYFEDVPGVLADARAAAREGDVLFVESWSQPAFKHYGAWSGPVVVGEAHEIETSLTKGKRVWVLYAREHEGPVLRAEARLSETFSVKQTIERRHGVIYVRATLWDVRR